MTESLNNILVPDMRKLYIEFPNVQTLSGHLSHQLEEQLKFAIENEKKIKLLNQ